MDNASVELQQFKSEINLVDYAAHCGYQVDTKKSSRKGTVMRLEADDDKILIGVTHGNRWVYHSLRDRTDKGTILDFMKRRKGLNLGEIRQELRRYTGTGAAWKTDASKRPTPQPLQEIDRKSIAEAYAKTTPVLKSGYLA